MPFPAKDGFHHKEIADSDTYTNTKSFSVAPGLYRVRRNNATGWFLTDITCTPTGKATINLFQRRAALTVASGDSVTCTYTVQQAARILARTFNDLVRTDATWAAATPASIRSALQLYSLGATPSAPPCLATPGRRPPLVLPTRPTASPANP